MLKNILRYACAVIVHISVFGGSVLCPPSAFGQTVEVVRVDGSNGSVAPAGLGDAWGTNHAYLYLQDGIDRALDILALPEPPDEVQIWVLGGERQ